MPVILSISQLKTALEGIWVEYPSNNSGLMQLWVGMDICDPAPLNKAF